MKMHREGFDGVTYDDFQRIFTKYILKNQMGATLNQITDRILNISTDTIIRYLALDATIRSKQQSLGDVLTEGDL